MTHGTGCGCPSCMKLGGERAFAKVGEPKAPQIFVTMTECERRIAEAVKAEREACLAIVGELELPPCPCEACVCRRRIAAAIRARGGKP